MDLSFLSHHLYVPVMMFVFILSTYLVRRTTKFLCQLDRLEVRMEKSRSDQDDKLLRLEALTRRMADEMISRSHYEAMNKQPIKAAQPAVPPESKKVKTIHGMTFQDYVKRFHMEPTTRSYLRGDVFYDFYMQMLAENLEPRTISENIADGYRTLADNPREEKKPTPAPIVDKIPKKPLLDRAESTIKQLVRISAHAVLLAFMATLAAALFFAAMYITAAVHVR